MRAIDYLFENTEKNPFAQVGTETTQPVIEYITFNDFVKNRRENKVLDEVHVKSDFAKWLLIGGAAVAVYYLVKKGGKK